MPQTPAPIFLIPIEGPVLKPLALVQTGGDAGKLLLGRSERCPLRLPASAEQASRIHCSFRFSDGQWLIADLHSRRGTFVNGVKLSAEKETPLVEGDLIRVDPWTFELSKGVHRRGVHSQDDRGISTVHTVAQAAAPPGRMEAELFEALLAASTSFHSASGEKELAERVIDAAIRGTGFPNAAVLKSLDALGQVQIVSSRSPTNTDSAQFTFSRSLLNAAATGQLAQISNEADQVASQSIISMKITAALCIPLKLGPSNVFFLYLDARVDRPQVRPAPPLSATVLSFVTALGQLASLALANLKRVEIEQRQRWLDKELRIARRAQELIMPRRQITIGPYQCSGECDPGQEVSGDFFDLIDLGDGKLAVALGDATGKGISASVLMTTTLGFLHAALKHYKEPSQAVTALNQFIAPRRRDDCFVSLWVGVLDSALNELRYVDAGHGYAMLVGGDRSVTQLNENGGPLIGPDESYLFEAAVLSLPSQGAVLVISDGIVEQPVCLPAAEAAGDRRPFEMEGVARSVATCTNHDDLLPGLFAAVRSHAGTEQLLDDATAVLVRWG